MLYDRITQRKRLLFSLSVFFAGIIGLLTVYSLRLNYPPIRSDGVGYYLYLPATFIYQDIGLQRIAVEHFNGHIPAWTGATIYPGTQNYLIKYPLGEALLLTPFFLLAGLASLVAGARIDGFSFLFQYAAAVSGLFYVTAGLSLLWVVLQKHFKQNTILLVLLGLLFGTNLFHYATYDSIFSHAYSFFLFCAFLWLVGNIYSRAALHHFIAAGAVAGLIIVTRPTNIIWLVFGALYGVASLQELRVRFQFWKDHAKKFLTALLPLLAIITLQLIYWKLITGKYVVYSYPNEHFNFLKPEIANVLFSIRKGLFFWSPILLTIFPGLIYVRKRSPEFFVPILLYFPINIYIISSWHCWWYGGSFGHRAFLESLPIFAISLCAFYEGIGTRVGKRVLLGGIVFCAVLSTWLMANYWTRVIPFDGATWNHLAQTFFIVRK